MLSLITSTLGVYLIGALSGGVLCYGLGYDRCFFDKKETNAEIDTIFLVAKGDINKEEYDKRMSSIKGWKVK